MKAAHDKAGDSAHWAMFEIAFGAETGTFIALTADSSMADVDTHFSSEKGFGEAFRLRASHLR